MFAKEDRIPDDDKHLRTLIDELGCTIPRTPGSMWGDFLQFITPTFVSNYEYVALVLDAIFIPDQGPHKVNATKVIENMEKHDIHVMQPGMVGDSRRVLNLAQAKGLDRCIVEVDYIETYVQVFTRDAWECYYKMLHYSGSRGWCYDICFKGQCPDLRQAQDFSMRAQLPQEEVFGTDLVDWAPEPQIPENGYQQGSSLAICSRLGCPVQYSERMDEISCPSSENDTEEDTKEDGGVDSVGDETADASTVS